MSYLNRVLGISPKMTEVPSLLEQVVSKPVSLQPTATNHLLLSALKQSPIRTSSPEMPTAPTLKRELPHVSRLARHADVPDWTPPRYDAGIHVPPSNRMRSYMDGLTKGSALLWKDPGYIFSSIFGFPSYGKSLEVFLAKFQGKDTAASNTVTNQTPPVLIHASKFDGLER